MRAFVYNGNCFRVENDDDLFIVRLIISLSFFVVGSLSFSLSPSASLLILSSFRTYCHAKMCGIFFFFSSQHMDTLSTKLKTYLNWFDIILKCVLWRQTFCWTKACDCYCFWHCVFCSVLFWVKFRFVESASERETPFDWPIFRTDCVCVFYMSVVLRW